MQAFLIKRLSKIYVVSVHKTMAFRKKKLKIFVNLWIQDFFHATVLTFKAVVVMVFRANIF